MTKTIKFPKNMLGAHASRLDAEVQAAKLNEQHGAGSVYVEIGSGTYKYWVRPTPWCKALGLRKVTTDDLDGDYLLPRSLQANDEPKPRDRYRFFPNE